MSSKVSTCIAISFVGVTPYTCWAKSLISSGRRFLSHVSLSVTLVPSASTSGSGNSYLGTFDFVVVYSTRPIHVRCRYNNKAQQYSYPGRKLHQIGFWRTR